MVNFTVHEPHLDIKKKIISGETEPKRGRTERYRHLRFPTVRLPALSLVVAGLPVGSSVTADSLEGEKPLGRNG